MPADSNLLIEAEEFCKNWGVADGVYVMLNPMGWCWLHIPGAQNKGEFFKQSFYVSREGMGNFLQGGSNRDWFSLRLKLDDFTSGFWTKCVDMAGGWEEVVTAGSWIGTRASTGVRVGSEGETDEAAESKEGAGRPLQTNKGQVKPLQCKQTGFGWFLEQQWLWIFSNSQCPEWDRPLCLARNWLWKICLGIAKFFEWIPKRG